MALTREELVNGLLAMIDEGDDFASLNMRKLARRIGCAHTNIYNYFSTWEELQWHAIAAALQGLLGQVPDAALAGNFGLIPPPGEPGNLIELYFSYGLEYPARYRFTWLDPVTGSPPEEVERVMDMPGRLFFGWLQNCIKAAGGKRDEKTVYLVGRYLHAYMHGELAFYAAGRIRGSQAPPQVEDLVERATAVYFRLLKKDT